MSTKVVILSSRTGAALTMLSNMYRIHAAVSVTKPPPLVLKLPTPKSEEDWMDLVFECCDCLVISLGFMQIIPKTFFTKIHTLNVHPGKLPESRGKDPHLQAIAAGAEYTAVTIHEVNEVLDGGKILVEVPVKILPEEREHPFLLDERLRRVAVYAVRALLEGIAPL